MTSLRFRIMGCLGAITPNTWWLVLDLRVADFGQHRAEGAVLIPRPVS